MRSKTNTLILILLLWMPISGIVNNLTDSSMNLLIGRVYRLLNIALLLLVIHKSPFKSVITKRIAILTMATIYLCFFHYETSINPPLEVKGVKDIVYSVHSSTSLLYHLMFGFSLSVFIPKYEKDFDSVISKFVVYSTIANAILMAIILSKYGVVFLLIEALKFNGVTLIVFSYQIIFTLLAIIYSWNQKTLSKSLLAVLCTVNLALILAMGKRGPLLAIFMVLMCMWLLHRYSLKKTFIVVMIVTAAYNLFTIYVDDIILLLKTVNERLGRTFADFYYYGDMNGRESLHEFAYEQIDNHPLWGRYPALITLDNYSWSFGLHPHNIYLEALMTMGYIGSIPFFVYLVYILFF